mgnify:FL=1|jgi:hypothetical protein|tara:strand:+ start:845 stop:1549 length:705 start_codon:yes stop_codon:yes gene_type:complete
MNNGAHKAIDSKISQNNLNPNNIKNQVRSETLDAYGIIEDFMFNQGTAIFNAQTKGGDNRFYKRNFSMPSTYGFDDNEPYSTKDQIMQLLSNSINKSPNDTVSTQSVQDLYKLHKQPMPKYREGGEVNESSFNSLFEYMRNLKKEDPSSDKLASLLDNLREQEEGAATQRYKELMGSFLGERPQGENEVMPSFESLVNQRFGGYPQGHNQNILRQSDPYLLNVYEKMQREKPKK